MSVKKQSHPIAETDIPAVGIVKAGTIVEHPKFGIGIVMEIAQWESGDITVRIEFDSYGSKWLVPEYARLSIPQSKPPKSNIFSRLFGKG